MVMCLRLVAVLLCSHSGAMALHSSVHGSAMPADHLHQRQRCPSPSSPPETSLLRAEKGNESTINL